jgi:hypothetical protein
MAGVKVRILLLLPVAVFIALFSVFILRGRAGEWHAQCSAFWQQQDWASLRGLARSLQRLNTADAEVEYFAALAAHQQKDHAAFLQLRSQWQTRKALNWSWERDLARIAAPHGLRESVQFLRARATTALLLLLAAFNILSLSRAGWITASCAVSSIGIALLLV